MVFWLKGGLCQGGGRFCKDDGQAGGMYPTGMLSCSKRNSEEECAYVMCVQLRVFPYFSTVVFEGRLYCCVRSYS